MVVITSLEDVKKVKNISENLKSQNTMLRVHVHGSFLKIRP